jgi:hypothetical protein
MTGRGTVQAQDAASGSGLTAAAFPDQSQGLVSPYPEADAIYSLISLHCAGKRLW